MYDYNTSYTSEVNSIVREVLLTLVIVPSVIGDCLQYRVKNPLIIYGLFAGLIYQIIYNNLGGIYLWLLGSLLPIFILGILFLIKALGAGDIKLFSVIGGFYGPRMVSRVIVIAFLVGGLLSIFQLIRSKNLIFRLQYLAEFISTSFITKKLSTYYSEARDGRACVIHFTIAIAVAWILCIRFKGLGCIF